MIKRPPSPLPEYISRLRKVNSIGVVVVSPILFLKVVQRISFWGNSALWVNSYLFFSFFNCVVTILALLFLIFLITFNFVTIYSNKGLIKRNYLLWSWIPIFISIGIGLLSFLVAPVVDFSCIQFSFGKCIPFIERIEEEFNISEEIKEYEPIIDSIESYHQDSGNYPANLSDLIPDYLDEIPSINIRSVNRLLYQPEPMWEDSPLFTFKISGNYPGFIRGLHGWALYYCPSYFSGCNIGGDSYRIDDNWLWIHSSWN